MTTTATAHRPSVHAGHAHPATKAGRAACRRANGQFTPTGSTNKSLGWVRTMTDEPAIWLRVTSRSPKSISFTLGAKASSITRPAHDAWFASSSFAARGAAKLDNMTV